MTNTLPDSIDMLNLNGIVPYDIKTFIKDGVQTSSASPIDVNKMMTGINEPDSFTKQDDKKAEKPKHKVTFGEILLGTSLVFLATTILSKKCPKVGDFFKKIGSNITKVLKK